MSPDQRQNHRIAVDLPILLCFGSQVTIQGCLKNISPQGAFVKVTQRLYLELNEELSFIIKRSGGQGDYEIVGRARISRITAGDGIAIYFTEMDEESSRCVRELCAGS